MTKIGWCLKQKNGIEMVEPSDNVSQSYLVDADDSLKAIERNVGKWRIVTAYYACYNALYALLMKAGIKSEIHDCTIELMIFFDFSENEISFLKNLKGLRIDVQYYLRPALEIDIFQAKLFIVHCKELVLKLDSDKIYKIRGKLSQK